MSWHLAYFPSPPWSFSLLHFVPFGFDPVPLCIFHSSDHFPSFFVLPSFSFLLPPPTSCALHFILLLFFSIARSPLYFSLPWKLCPCPYLFLVQSLFSSYFSCLFHHGAHVHVCLLCWSLHPSSVRPLPTSLPIPPPWPRVDSPLACLPCSPFSTSSPLYLCTRLCLSASLLPLLISFTDSYFFIAPLHLQDPSISRFLSPS